MGEDPANHSAGLAPQRNARRGPRQREPEGGHGLSLPDDHVYADAKDEEVYAVTKAIVDNYEPYKPATPIMERWEVSNPGAFPMDAPFHNGAIKFLKENHIWTTDHRSGRTASLSARACCGEAGPT